MSQGNPGGMEIHSHATGICWRGAGVERGGRCGGRDEGRVCAVHLAEEREGGEVEVGGRVLCAWGDERRGVGFTWGEGENVCIALGAWRSGVFVGH